MGEDTLQLLIGPYGLSVAAVLTVVAVTRASIHLYRQVIETHEARLKDQQRYLDLMESQRDYYEQAMTTLAQTKAALEQSTKVHEQVVEYLRKAS